MAKFNWDKVRTEHFAEKHGAEYISSDSLPAGYSSARSSFTPQIVKCPYCNNSIASALLQNHYFTCAAVRSQRYITKMKVWPKKIKKSKKVATKKIKSQNKGSKPKTTQEAPVRINTPFKSLSSILQGIESNQSHPLKGAKITQLKRMRG